MNNLSKQVHANMYVKMALVFIKLPIPLAKVDT